MSYSLLLTAALLLILCTAVQTTVTIVVIHLLGKLARGGYFAAGFMVSALILGGVAAALVLSFVLQIALWALAFLWHGEFTDFATAFYHSAVNYTTLGYGDIVMSPRWRLLGPLEAINGLLMGGFSASLFFTVAGRMLTAWSSAAGGKNVKR
jgi:hypothetical protein